METSLNVTDYPEPKEEIEKIEQEDYREYYDYAENIMDSNDDVEYDNYEVESVIGVSNEFK